MNAAKRLQLNIQVDSSMLLHPKLQATFLPIAWFEEKSAISDSLAQQFIDEVRFSLLIK